MKNQRKIKEYLLNKIDPGNPVEVEKVDRYINLLKIFYSLDNDIKEHGTTVHTENSSQSFLKTNPAIAEKNKVNSSLLALEKSLGLDKIEVEEEPTSELI